MGIYSEKLIEEAKKSKIDTSKNDFSEVDNQIESMITKMRDEYGIDVQGIRNSILHKMENDIESFIDSKGNLIVSGITNTVDIIVKASVNEKRESIDVENSKVEKQQLDAIERMAKEENVENEVESFNELWKRDAEKIIDLFDNLEGNMRTIDPTTFGAKGNENFIEVWNIDPKNEVELERQLRIYANSKEVSPEEGKKIISNLDAKMPVKDVWRRYLADHPEKMKIIIDQKMAQVIEGSISRDDFNRFISESEYDYAKIKEMLLSEFPELAGETSEFISYEEVMELNVVNGAIDVASKEILEIDGINNISQLRQYCISQEMDYDEIVEKLKIGNKDKNSQINDIKAYLKKDFEVEKAQALYKKLSTIKLAEAREKFYNKSEFFNKVGNITTQEEFDSLLLEYDLEDFGLSLDSVHDEEMRILIIERLDENFIKMKQDRQDIKVGLSKATTAKGMNKIRSEHMENVFYEGAIDLKNIPALRDLMPGPKLKVMTNEALKIQEQKRNEILDNVGNRILTEKDLIKYIEMRNNINESGKDQLRKDDVKKYKKNNDSHVKLDIYENKNQKEDDRNLKEKASFDTQREVAFIMKNELGEKRSLREIVMWQTDFDEFKKVYLEKVLGIEAKISDEDFEKMFMLKETLREKDRMYEQLIECTTEKEFNEMVEQLEIDMLDLKFGQDPSEIYTDEDLEKMVEIVKIMRNIETRQISKPEEEEITEDTVVDIEKVEEKAEEPKTDEKPNLNIMIANPEYIAEKGKQIMQTICNDRINVMSHTQAKEKKGMPNKLEIRENKLPYFEKTVKTKWEKLTSSEMIWAVDKNRNILKTEGLPYKVEKNDGTIRAINELTSKANSTTVQTKKSEGYDKHALNIEEKTWNVKTTLGQSLKVQEEYSLDDFSDFTAMIDEFEMELEQQTEQPVVAVVDKKITGPASLAKAMAKPKEMVLDYMEMNIGSGTDPKNATLVMADMLRDNKLLTKFKGASEQGITLEEYSDIMSGVVVETEAMIADGKLPAVISENNQERETTIDDFINMTFDDTEILLSNLPERPQGLDKEEVRELIESQVLEAQRLQEQHTEENLGEGEKTQQELAEMLKAQQREKEVEVEAKEEKNAEVIEPANQEVVQEEKIVTAKEVEPAVEEIVQEEPKVEQALTVVEEKSLAQKVGGRLSGFFQSAKEKVSKFVENIKEKLSGSNNDKNFGSEVFAMDATKGKKNKTMDDQWGTVNVDIKAAREYAKEIQEAKQAAGNEKETVSVSERNDD